MSDAQVGYSRLAVARALRGHLRVTEERLNKTASFEAIML